MIEFEIENDFLDDSKKTVSNQFDNKLVYMSSALARQLHFSKEEEKLFAMAISQLDFFSNENDLYVDLYVSDIREKLDIFSTSDYTDLREQYVKLMDKSKVMFYLTDEPNEEDRETLDGRLIRSIRGMKGKSAIRVRFDEEFKPALKFCKLAYTRIPLDDTLSYKSKYAIILQRYLTTLYKVGKQFPIEQTFIFSTKQLKNIFGLSKEEYVKSDGAFNRWNFEKQTLCRACDEINSHSSCMRIDFEKETKRRIVYYKISVVIATKIKKTPPPIDMEMEEQMQFPF